VYRYARRNRILPRTHVPPTQGIEMAPENTHHDKYFTEDEIDRLVKIARVFDNKWGKMASKLSPLSRPFCRSDMELLVRLLCGIGLRLHRRGAVL